MATQIKTLKDSFSKGEKSYKKAFEDASEECWAFEEDWKVIQQKKDDLVNHLRGMYEEVVVARHKSQDSLQRVVDVVYRVWD